ncbi:MAG: hypothetical protein WCT32_03865 [Patescibacteria group bacterium]|jgi:hypothetical protein
MQKAAWLLVILLSAVITGNANAADGWLIGLNNQYEKAEVTVSVAVDHYASGATSGDPFWTWSDRSDKALTAVRGTSLRRRLDISTSRGEIKSIRWSPIPIASSKEASGIIKGLTPVALTPGEGFVDFVSTSGQRLGSHAMYPIVELDGGKLSRYYALWIPVLSLRGKTKHNNFVQYFLVEGPGGNCTGDQLAGWMAGYHFGGMPTNPDAAAGEDSEEVVDEGTSNGTVENTPELEKWRHDVRQTTDEAVKRIQDAASQTNSGESRVTIKVFPPRGYGGGPYDAVVEADGKEVYKRYAMPDGHEKAQTDGKPLVVKAPPGTVVVVRMFARQTRTLYKTTIKVSGDAKYRMTLEEGK